MEEKNALEELKKDYVKLRKKYSLPSFKALNEDFDIEKIASQETDCLLREVRKQMIDKVIAYLRFVEMLMNPSNAPMFFFALVKGMTASDKKCLEGIYDKLGVFEIDVVGLDVKYSEKNEAEFINRLAGKWGEIGEDIIKLVDTLKVSWKQKAKKDERGYCG